MPDQTLGEFLASAFEPDDPNRDDAIVRVVVAVHGDDVAAWEGGSEALIDWQGDCRIYSNDAMTALRQEQDARARLALAVERNEQLVAERDFLRRVVLALVDPTSFPDLIAEARRD